MFLSNRLAFASLFLGCVVAAAGGGYLATRHVAESSVNAAPASDESPASPVSSLPTVGSSDLRTPETPDGGAEAPPATPIAPASTDTTGNVKSSATLSARETTTGASHRPETRALTPSRKAVPQKAAASSQPAPRSSVSTPDQQPPATVSIPEPPSHEVTAASPSHVAEAKPIVAEAPTVDVETRPEPTLEELVVTADSVVGLEIETTVSSERARVEDSVDARVVRDVRVGRRVAIPAGSRVMGSVVAVDRGGKFKDRARLGVRFHTLLLADGSRSSMTTETIYRYGEAPGDGSAKKIGGGAVAGAILGALIGGAKGAAIGATAGAGGGTAVVMRGERSAATFMAGSEVTARFTAPVSVTVDR